MLAISLFLTGCRKDDTGILPTSPSEFGKFDYSTERAIALEVEFETKGLSLQPLIGTPVEVEVLIEGKRVRISRGFIKPNGLVIDLRVPAFARQAWIVSDLTKAEHAFNLDQPKKSVSFEVYRASMGVQAIKQRTEEETYQRIAQARPAGGANNRDFDKDGVDDDFDEFPLDPARAFSMMEPAWGYNTYAFEDLWPSQGDYDFNDLVLDHRIKWIFNGKQERVEAEGELVVRAQGAGLPNGLALQLLSYDPNGSTYQHLPAGVLGNIGGHLSEDPAAAANTAIVSQHLSASLKSYYTNLDDVGPNRIPDTLHYHFGLNEPSSLFIRTDFFLLRGDNSLGKSDRSVEIHVCGRPATTAANPELFGSLADRTGNGSWYKDKNSMPWGMEIFATPLQFGPSITGNVPSNNGVWLPFAYPRSRVRIDEAYPSFRNWASNNGRSAHTWMTQGIADKIWIPAWQR